MRDRAEKERDRQQMRGGERDGDRWRKNGWGEMDGE